MPFFSLINFHLACELLNTTPRDITTSSTIYLSQHTPSLTSNKAATHKPSHIFGLSTTPTSQPCHFHTPPSPICQHIGARTFLSTRRFVCTRRRKSENGTRTSPSCTRSSCRWTISKRRFSKTLSLSKTTRQSALGCYLNTMLC